MLPLDGEEKNLPADSSFPLNTYITLGCTHLTGSLESSVVQFFVRVIFKTGTDGLSLCDGVV